MAKIKTEDGQVLTAHASGFVVGSENFNEYVLDDGTLVRVKHVLTAVLVSDEPDSDDRRRYAFRCTPVYDVRESSSF